MNIIKNYKEEVYRIENEYELHMPYLISEAKLCSAKTALDMAYFIDNEKAIKFFEEEVKSLKEEVDNNFSDLYNFCKMLSEQKDGE